MSDWPFGDLPMFGFDFAMIDPPWRFETYSEAGKAQKSPEVHYETMALDEICALPVGHLLRGDAIVWLWGTHPMIEQQFKVVRAWGLNPVTTGVWVKRTRTGKLAFGTGYRLRSASEPFIIATVGNPETARTIRTVIEGRVREHSRKPEEAYQEAERMMPKAWRADLFSRRVAPGWRSWNRDASELHKFTPKKENPDEGVSQGRTPFPLG